MAAPTLRDLVLAVGVPFRDNLAGTTTADAGPRNLMVDARRQGDADDIYRGSEVLFLDTAGMAADNPLRVVASDAASGALTLDDDWGGSTGVPAGTRYVLMRLRGKGVPYDYRVQALQLVVEAMAQEGLDVEVTVPGGAVRGQYAYPIPAGLDTLHTVLLRRPAGSDMPFWQQEVPPGRPGGAGPGWYLQPGRTLLVTYRKLGWVPADLVLRGRYYPAFTGSLDDSFPVPKDEAVAGAVEWLTLLATQPERQAANTKLMQERARSGGDYLYPSEQRIY